MLTEPASTVSALALPFAVAWGAENVTGTWRPFFESSFTLLMWLFVLVLSVAVPLWVWGRLDDDKAKVAAGKNNAMVAGAQLTVLALSPAVSDAALGAI